MDLDIDISSWILEFILQQPIDDNIVNALIQVLPIKIDNFNLKKVLILRKIVSEISNGLVAEKILEFIELFEELEHQEGIESLMSMKFAYCAVAVECTMKFLNNKKAGSDKGGYFEAVKRIWKRRINLMEKMENVGVESEELWRWRDEIEAALWDDKCCEYVIRRSKEVFAVDAVKAFVREAKERIGSPFLEVVAATYQSDDTVRSLLGGVNKEGACESNARGVRTGDALPRKKHVAFKRTRRASASTCGGVRISDSVEKGLDASSEQDKLLPTPKIVEAAEEALKLSSLELRAVVKDPLPDALKIAETLSSVARDDMGHQPAEINNDGSPHPVVVSSKMTQANKETCNVQRNCHQDATSKPKHMEQKSAAPTSEDDSIDDSSEESPSGRRRVTLPTPKRTIVSPLKKYEFKKPSTRRKSTKWSALEEDTLREGVKKHGVGNWKLILEAYRDIFAVRTAVDLKDKWRNLMS